VAAAIAFPGSHTLLIAAALIAVIGVLWVLADDKRTERLVRVIRAIRRQQHVGAPETQIANLHPCPFFAEQMAHAKNSLRESIVVSHSEILFPSSSIPSRGPM
jgi:hypothetical protein